MCRLALVIGWSLGLLAAAGCSSLGPGTVARDRFDYSSSISESWKRQTLLNIVKLRYLDPPIFVDVGQIVAGYSLETGITASGTVRDGSILGNNATLGGSAKFTDRPTVTYTPLTGNKFIRGLMTPLPPETVLFTIQSGWPADAVMFIAVASMNNLKNETISLGGVALPDAAFIRALDLMRKIQISGSVGVRIQEAPQKQHTTLMTFRAADVPAQTLSDIHEFRKLMRLDPEAREFRIVFGETPENDREVAMLTRSILHIMQTMAAAVNLPAGDVEQGRAIPGLASSGDGPDRQRLVRIHSSKEKPTNAFVVVPYRDYWFWIDDRDLRTKRVFSFMMLLFTLADTGEKDPLPLITIPAQ